MTDQMREALEKCLSALEWVVEQGGGPECEHESGVVCFCKENGAINAAREAIASAQQADHIGDVREMVAAPVVPEEWRTQIEKAISRAKVFDDGSDGADAESAQSVVAILRALLAAPAPEQREKVELTDAEYRRGFTDGYNQRDAEVLGALV